MYGEIDFSSHPWPNISESAKDLVKRMLARDPRKRITAHQVLCKHLFPSKYEDIITKSVILIEISFVFLAAHPWVQVDGVAPDEPMHSAVLSRMMQFSAMNKLKKMAIRVCNVTIRIYTNVSYQILIVIFSFGAGDCRKPLRGGDRGAEGDVQDD